MPGQPAFTLFVASFFFISTNFCYVFNDHAVPPSNPPRRRRRLARQHAQSQWPRHDRQCHRWRGRRKRTSGHPRCGRTSPHGRSSRRRQQHGLDYHFFVARWRRRLAGRRPFQKSIILSDNFFEKSTLTASRADVREAYFIY